MELCAERDLSSYSRFTRSSVGEFMSLFSKTVAERTRPGQRQDVEEQSYTFHAYARSEGVAGIIISDQEYPALVAHQLLGKITDEFLSRYPRSAYQGKSAECPFPQLKEYIVKYQDPQQADSIMKVGTCSVNPLGGGGDGTVTDKPVFRSRKSSTRRRSCCTRLSSPCWSEARRLTVWWPSPTV